MKFIITYIALIFLTAGCFSQEKQATKAFEEIVLVNKIDFADAKLNQPKFGCGFLLQFGSDTFAVTAKHIVKVIKPTGMTTLSFENNITGWSMYPLNNKTELITCGKLLNENKSEQLDAKATYDEDWLIFSVKQNLSKAKPLQIRTAPLVPGEKIYVVGWTRTMEDGPQRVYEFEYYKTIGNRILLKDIVVPEKFGGLSGSPVVDENGLVVGLVSNGTEDPETGKKYFSPCAIGGVISFLEKRKEGK